MKLKAIVLTNSYEKDIKSLAKSGRHKLEEIDGVIDFLERGHILPKKYKDHVLIGEWDGYRECHIRPDWILIYRVTDDEVILTRTGSHSKLF